MPQGSLEKLEKTLEYCFREKQWLSWALTHSSALARNGETKQDNERLEFLGDVVLGFIVSDRLYRECPHLGEGELSRARAQLVSAPHLAQVARKLNVGKYLILGRGEEKSGGRDKRALLVDAVEALIAALYRDGGLRAAEQFVETFVLPPNLNVAVPQLVFSDHKSALQERLQADRKGMPVYRVIRETGPEHQKTFTVEVRGGDHLSARGRGPSKKVAEQEAAHALYVKFTKEQ